MAEISLKAYVEYIEDRLARDAITEVVAQCRYILESYPKYVEAYKLLGRALMEREKNQDALDLFQRVLSANPNDFVAHVGMSECYRDTGAMDQAIWHLERAFEQTPSNIDLQNAIKDLYFEQNQEAPRRIQLTGGALARHYIRGELYKQAILELRKALRNEPDRIDLKVVLADALWRDGQHVDAGRTAAEVLRRLPNSIEANRILAQLWLRAGNIEEAKPYLGRVKDLDPYVGYEVEYNTEPAADTFRLPMLEYTADQYAAEIGAADWVSEIGAIAREKDTTSPVHQPEESAPAADRPSIADIFSDAPQQVPSESGAAPVDAGDESPDWLSDALATGAGLDEPLSPAAAVDEEMPDIEGLFPDVDQADEPSPTVDAPAAPGWLEDALGVSSAVPPQEVPAEAKPSAEISEGPDWLADALGSAPADTTEAPVEVDDTPDWLDETLGDAPDFETDEEPDTVTPEGFTDWLDETLETPTTPSETPAAADIVDDDDESDWLGETLGEASEHGTIPSEEPAPEDTPNWLDETLGEETPAIETPESEPEAVAPPLPIDDVTAEDEKETPGWLADILSGKEEEASAPGVSAPDEEEELSVVSDDWLDDFLTSEDSFEEPEPAATPAAQMQPDEAVVPSIELPPGQLQTWDSAESGAAVAQESAVPGSSPPVPAPPAAEPPAIPETPADVEPVGEAADTLPDWLGSVEADAEDEPAPPEGESSDELPDWLADAAGDAEIQDPPDFETADDADELPDWLEGAPIDEGVSDEGSEDEVLPDWLSSEGLSDAEGTSEDDQESGDLPDWLQGGG